METLGIEPDALVVAHVSKLDPLKRPLDVVLAAERALSVEPRLLGLIVGDGPLRKHYYKAAGGDPDIVFVGAVLEGRPEYYANCAIYACPTTKASFGITLLESMACQTPVVCSDILGFRDVVMHGREALMVPREDRDALANALVHLLDDEGLRTRLGETGRKRALEYDWRRVTASIVDVYHDVLSPPRVPIHV